MSKHLHIHVHDSAYSYNGTYNKRDVPQNNKKHHYFTYNGVYVRTTTTKVPVPNKDAKDKCQCK